MEILKRPTGIHKPRKHAKYISWDSLISGECRKIKLSTEILYITENPDKAVTLRLDLQKTNANTQMYHVIKFFTDI